MHSRKSQFFALLTIAIFLIAGNLLVDRWPTTLYHGDSNGYYLHVVSFFVNGDVGDYNKTIAALQKQNPNSVDPRADVYGVRQTDIGRYCNKYPLGVPIMETPFFLLAHVYAKIDKGYEANGWSQPYLFVISFAIIFYVLFGFYLLMRVLAHYFDQRTVLVTTLTLALATNLFYQSTYVTMAHGFLFFQHSLLIYLTHKFYQKPGKWLALGIGASVGLITLTRVPELISALVPLLWGINSWKSLWERIRFWITRYDFLLLAAAGLLIAFSPQLIYWYYVSGQIIYNPYVGEGFDFTHPNLLSGWFDFANGWLIYSPIMILSLVGWFFIGKKCSDARWPVFVFVGLHAYIHYSWHAWTYYPGLGSRPMVDAYPLLSFSLAAFFALSLNKKTWQWIVYTLLILAIALNLFQTWQMKEGIIWSERHNRAFFIESFGKTKLDRNALIAYESNQLQPDTSILKRVQTLFKTSFEDSTAQFSTQEIVHAGEFSWVSNEEFVFSVSDTMDLSEVKGGDWIRLGVQVYMRGADRNWNRDACAVLGIECLDNEGNSKKWRAIRMTPFIGNKDFSIWNAGEQDQWGEAYFFYHVPKNFKPGWKIRANIWNPHRQRLYYDDLKVELFK